jgi:hypothetical protein
MIATVNIRDLSIAGCDRWETNEKAQASRVKEHSFLCRVSAQSLRSQTTTSGLLLSTQPRTLGTRTSTLATQGTRTTTLRRTRTTLGRSGNRAN